MNDYKSAQTNELFAALAKAQAEMQTASLDANNPFFKSKYADLAAIVAASRPALAKYGLSIMQPILTDESGQYLVTVLGHQSGQWIESRIKLNPQKADPQSIGSMITYYRRYSMLALCGIVASDASDDDGEAAMQEQRPAYKPKQITQTSSKYINESQIQDIEKKMELYPHLAKQIQDVNLRMLSEKEYYTILSLFPNN